VGAYFLAFVLFSAVPVWIWNWVLRMVAEATGTFEEDLQQSNVGCFLDILFWGGYMACLIYFGMIRQ